MIEYMEEHTLCDDTLEYDLTEHFGSLVWAL